MDKATDIEETLWGMADERQAVQMLRFFKTGPGEYGEGDKFMGLRNPQVRLVVKEAWRTTPLEEARELVCSEWHETRLCGLLIMVEKYLNAMKRKATDEMEEIFKVYTSLHPHINNWDLVDLSAIKIVGWHEVQNPGLKLMDDWIKPEGHTLWQQRISMVSTWMLIRHQRTDECLRRAEQLLDSPEPLLHKAAGWMLRELWKHGYRRELLNFLTVHAGRIPSVMRSYACEKMSPDQRQALSTIICTRTTAKRRLPD